MKIVDWKNIHKHIVWPFQVKKNVIHIIYSGRQQVISCVF